MQQVTAWPNQLGADVVFYGAECEVWRHSDCFRVFTADKVALIPFCVTTDPVEAVSLTFKCGLDRAKLDEMDYRDAEQLFHSYFVELAERLTAQSKLFA